MMMSSTRIRHGLAFVLIAIASLPAWALSDAELAQRLAARFEGDRSGVCVVAAVIEGPKLSRAQFCANPDGQSRTAPSLDAAFEIGSISKTMTAFLVADLIDAGRWSLDDPIARHLPEGTVVPRQGDRQILVRDLLTHSAGLPRLPPDFKPKNRANPYADLTEDQMLAALGRVQLNAPISSKSVYSNFGMMIMSIAVARAWRAEGADLEQVLAKRLFGPLQMGHAYVANAPAGQRVATGHVMSGATAPAWTMATNLAGVGMVHATLDDMVNYTRAHLGLMDTPLLSRLRMTQQPLAHNHGMNWVVRPVKGSTVVMHGGATGGFHTHVAMRPDQQRGVVLLADTDITPVDELTDLSLSLLGLDVPMPKPRLRQPIPAALLQALPGQFSIAGLNAKVWLDEGRLMAQADGQPAMELRYDSRGDIYPQVAPELRLRPIVENGQVNRFAWHQAGMVLEGVREGHALPLTATRPEWQAWAGEYRLTAGFALRIFEQNGQLKLQGTGQPAIEAVVTGPDRIEIQVVKAVVEFQRNERNEVISATLRQNGQVLVGAKAPAAVPKKPD